MTPTIVALFVIFTAWTVRSLWESMNPSRTSLGDPREGMPHPDDKFYKYAISDTELDPCYIEVVRERLECQDRRFKDINERLLAIDGYSVHSEEGHDVTFPVIEVDRIMSYILVYTHPGSFPQSAYPTVAGDTYLKALYALKHGEEKIQEMLEAVRALEIELEEPFVIDKKD
jgi:hypothetical protein